MGFFAEGDSEPGGANAWDNMAPLEKDFKQGFGDARQYYKDAFNNGNAWAPNAQAATVGPTTIARTDGAAMGYQQGNAALLADIANGKQQGAGSMAMQANLARGVAGNNAMAATRARSPNMMGGAARMAGNTNAAMMAGGESKLMAMQAQEKMAAEAALTGQLGGMRQQSMGVASEQARMNAATGLANAGFANQTGLENQYAGLYHDAWKQKALAAGAAHDQQAWENDMAKRRVKAGMDMVDDGKEWRENAQQDMARGYTADTVGTVTGATLKYGGSK